MQIALVHTEGLIGLNVDAIRAVVVVEVVDILRTHEDIEGRGNLGQRDAHRFRFWAINCDQQLRVAGGEAREKPREAEFRIPARSDDAVRNLVEVGEGILA
jgi:hypothetical protein